MLLTPSLAVLETLLRLNQWGAPFMELVAAAAVASEAPHAIGLLFNRATGLTLRPSAARDAQHYVQMADPYAPFVHQPLAKQSEMVHLWAQQFFGPRDAAGMAALDRLLPCMTEFAHHAPYATHKDTINMLFILCEAHPERVHEQLWQNLVEGCVASATHPTTATDARHMMAVASLPSHHAAFLHGQHMETFREWLIGVLEATGENAATRRGEDSLTRRLHAARILHLPYLTRDGDRLQALSLENGGYSAAQEQRIMRATQDLLATIAGHTPLLSQPNEDMKTACDALGNTTAYEPENNIIRAWLRLHEPTISQLRTCCPRPEGAARSMPDAKPGNG